MAPKPEAEVDRMAGELMGEVLRRGSLDDVLAPDDMVEALISPEHLPVAAKLLAMFGTRPGLSPRTERAGQYMSEGERHGVAQRWEREESYIRSGNRRPLWERPGSKNLPHCSRLQALCMAHCQRWEGQGQQIYHVVREMIAPRLGWKLEIPKPADWDQAGDYNLVVSYLVKHWGELRPLFLKMEGEELRRSRAVIALNPKEVGVRSAAVAELVAGLESLIGPVDLSIARMDEGKLANRSGRLPREGETNITREYQAWFVNLDLSSHRAIEDAVGLQVDQLDPTARNNVTERVQALQLLALSVMEELPGGPEKPISTVKSKVGFDMRIVLGGLRSMVMQPNTSERNTRFIQAIDPRLGRMSDGQALKFLIKMATHDRIWGLGGGRALLTRHTELLKTGKAAEAEQVEKLMHLMTRLMSDPLAMDKVGIDKLLGQ